MNAMNGIMSMAKLDLISIRGVAKQMLLLYGICGVVVAIGMGSAVAIAPMLAVLAAMMLSFNLSAFDELNGWARFRAAFPLSRNDIVRGRYASILILCLVALVAGVILAIALQLIFSAIPGSIGARFDQSLPIGALFAASILGICIVLLLDSVMLPFVFRYGFTKATRIVPVIIICVGVAVFASVMGDFDVAAFQGSWIAVPSHAILVLVGIVLLSLAIYVASSVVSCRIYANKEL